MKETDIKEKIAMAEKAVEDIKDEKLKVKAFEIVLNGLLAEKASVSPPGNLPAEPTENPVKMIITSKTDWSDYELPKLDPVSQYLLIIKIALDDFKIDGLTAPQIGEILMEKFRISKTYQAISMSLMGAVGKYVDRFSSSAGYKYRIIEGGINRLKEKQALSKDDQK